VVVELPPLLEAPSAALDGVVVVAPAPAAGVPCAWFEPVEDGEVAAPPDGGAVVGTAAPGEGGDAAGAEPAPLELPPDPLPPLLPPPDAGTGATPGQAAAKAAAGVIFGCIAFALSAPGF
jgi:hypothetical protein